MSVHALALGVLAGRRPYIKYKRFRASVVEAISPTEGADETRHALARFRYVPDAYYIEPPDVAPPRVIAAFEVEDTNTMNEGKLRAYIDLWWFCDATKEFAFQLWTVDRYGREAVVDLCALAYADLSKATSPAAAVPPTFSRP